MEILAYSNEVTPMPWEGDVAAGDSGSPRTRRETTSRNVMPCSRAKDLDPGPEEGHVVDKSHGGKDVLSNLRALCLSCNQGAKNIMSEKPSTIWLLSQIRRAGSAEQRAVYDWLKQKFDNG